MGLWRHVGREVLEEYDTETLDKIVCEIEEREGFPSNTDDRESKITYILDKGY